jgi:tetratricopeptide (TPR) repeat protein
MKKSLLVISLLWLTSAPAPCLIVDIQALFSQAQKFESEQHWSEAFSTYTEILKFEPENAQAHYRLGTVSEKIGATDSALKSYQEALRLNPGLTEARTALEGYYVNRGVALRRSNQSDEAIRAFQQALSIVPSSASAHFELGQAFEQRGQTDDAVKEYQETIKLDPNRSAAHVRLAAVYSNQGQHERAAQEYQEILRVNPEDPAAHYGLGVTYSEMGQREQAIASLKQAVRFYLIAGQRDKAQPAYALQKKLEAEQQGTPPAAQKK